MNTDQGAVLWLTGLSGAGKTTIARSLAVLFRSRGMLPVMLDGDEIRNATGQRGFDEASREAHNLTVGRLAALFESQGHLVIVSMISPYQKVRQQIREICKSFIEIYVDTPLDVCIERDPKGLYKKAINREITEFTGISSPYQPPGNPELRIDTLTLGAEACAAIIGEYYYTIVR